MTDREIMEQAADVLQAVREAPASKDEIQRAWIVSDLLRRRLAQQEQEPVAHVYLFEPNGRPRVAWDNAKDIKIGDKLYTTPPQGIYYTPPQRKPLTDAVLAEREACAAMLEANAMACENPIYRSLLQANAQAIREMGQP